ncbi:unnamed protein product [Onchocerca ochengi]|uniref:C3H1-type domain-containing protein n=1 Tax=Onchocerca ochengi TaxID=42157 RepID=A0A182EJW1_ONCOC|nr:unnamed protein product [Onchocerca ochengi]
MTYQNWLISNSAERRGRSWLEGLGDGGEFVANLLMLECMHACAFIVMYDENSNAAAAAAAASSTSSTGLMSQLLNVKDSRWLQLEVCREFQRGQCSRSDVECKFAHPPPHVDVQNGRVTACYDSIKLVIGHLSVTSSQSNKTS